VTNTLYDALIAPHANNTDVFLTLDDGQDVSYASFVARVAQLAHVLTDAGVKPGDRIVVQAPKLMDTIALYGAALQTGVIYLPLNTAYTQSEVQYFIQDATPRLVICDAPDKAEIAAICGDDTAVLTLASDNSGSLSHSADACPTTFTTVPRGPDELAALLYTSGTTGRSKGAMMSHKNLLSNAQTLTALWQITSKDRLIHALPIFHTHGLFVALNTALLAGAHLERYGMTETNMITSNPYDGARVAGTVGYPLVGTEVQITDDGTPTAAGDIGMIEVRGDNVFQGYWNMPEKTAEELRDNGFFITGDLGVMSDDGRVSIVGRHKDLIISGGYNIYPKEVEDVINAISGVLESAVFGVPHPDFGESVVAAVVLTDPSLGESAITSAVAATLARFKQPKRYIIMDALPRNTMGKVQKTILRATYGAEASRNDPYGA